MSFAVDCPECGRASPTIRRPASLRQALRGGWTCRHCGAEIDRWDRMVGRAGFARTSWTRDDSTTAGRPGRLALADDRLRHLRPDLYAFGRRVREAVGLEFPLRRHVAEQLAAGDADAAVVVSTRPLVVAAYADGFDRAVLLAFGEEFGLVEEYGLRDGTTLVTINGYGSEPAADADLFLPPGYAGRWTGLQPLIADFVSDDGDRLDDLRASIPESHRARAESIGRRHLAKHPGLARDGRPIHCLRPA